MPYAYGDSIHDCVVITYQSFGLDRKKHAQACFFLAGMARFELTNARVKV